MTPEEFRRVRKAARMTQAQMAARLGKSRKTIVNWEAGTHTIPNDALDKLTERGIAPEATPTKPISPATHPELYDPGVLKNTFLRNHKHPHWFARNTRLGYYLTDAVKEQFHELIAYPDDIEKLQWTPARAVAFIEQLGIPTETAKELAAEVGFNVPIDRDPYLVAQQEFFRAYPLATVDDFLNARPEFKPRQVEMAGKPDLAIQQALDDAFNLKL
jgi:transcriptional regulator with XRE-family HTH domain